LLFLDNLVSNIDMRASILDKELAMRTRQAAFGACIAAALVFGAGAGPVKAVPASSTAGLGADGVRVLCDRILNAVLDTAGEIKAEIRQF
jgi:hypothetical protein